MRRLAIIAVLVPLTAAPALAANPNFPGTNPDESVRANMPDDPQFADLVAARYLALAAD